MKKTAITIYIILSIYLPKTQAQNLIHNSSFENYSGTCYCGGTMAGGGLFDDYTVTPAQHKVNDWYSFITPDYFNVLCATSTTNNVMYNELGNIYPKTGNAFAGFIASSGSIGEAKEYIYQQLSNPLIGGKTYCLNFYVSLADACSGAIEKIGAYFSASLPSLNSALYLNATPQVQNTNGIISDTTNWVNIQGCFTAIGNEQYIIIGNFNSNANSNLIVLPTSYTITSGEQGYAYYYIDDIELYDQSTVDVKKSENQTNIVLYPNPTGNTINIEVGKIDHSKNIKFIITNLLGRVILKTDYSPQYDISSFENGIYFLSIFENEQLLTVQKIIKQ